MSNGVLPHEEERHREPSKVQPAGPSVDQREPVMLTALSLLAAEGPAQPVDPGGGSSVAISGMLVVASIAAVAVVGFGMFVIVRAAILSAEKKSRQP